MSTDYWPIMGLGINMEPRPTREMRRSSEGVYHVDIPGGPVIDLAKIASEFPGVDIKAPEWADIIAFLSDKAPEGYNFDWSTTGNACNGEFMLYWPAYPWEFKLKDLVLTENSVRQVLADLLEPYLAEGRTREWLEDEIDFINTYGCG